MAQPDKPATENAGQDRRAFRQARDLAALDEDLLAEGKADGFPCLGLQSGRRHAPAFDGIDQGRFPTGREHQPVADGQPPTLDPPGDDAPVVEFVDVLHRQAQRQLDRTGRRAEAVERLDQCRPLIPGHAGRALHQVLALAGRDGNRRNPPKRRTRRDSRNRRGGFPRISRRNNSPDPSC